MEKAEEQERLCSNKDRGIGERENKCTSCVKIEREEEKNRMEQERMRKIIVK